MKKRERLTAFFIKPPLWFCIAVWVIGGVSLVGTVTLYYLGLGGRLWAISVHICTLVFFILSIYAVLTVIGVPERAKKSDKVKRFFAEYDFRAYVYAAVSVIVNICYVVFGIIVAVLSRSVWLGALVGYHVFLILPRVWVIYVAKIRGKKDDDDESEERSHRRSLLAYKYCGLALILLALAIVPVIRLTIEDKNSYDYFVSAVTYVSAIAFYSFTKLGISVYNFKKAHRSGDYALIAVKNISFADALISIFALQAMMLKEVGGGNARLASILNPALGGAVALTVFSLGLAMLVHGYKLAKRI